MSESPELISKSQLISLKKVAKTYQAGETICIEGEPSRDLMLLLQGAVEVVRGGDVVNTIRGQQIFIGQIAFFQQRKRQYRHGLAFSHRPLLAAALSLHSTRTRRARVSGWRPSARRAALVRHAPIEGRHAKAEEEAIVQVGQPLPRSRGRPGPGRRRRGERYRRPNDRAQGGDERAGRGEGSTRARGRLPRRAVIVRR